VIKNLLPLLTSRLHCRQGKGLISCYQYLTGLPRSAINMSIPVLHQQHMQLSAAQQGCPRLPAGVDPLQDRDAAGNITEKMQ
jgi:hypothetical protein